MNKSLWRGVLVVILCAALAAPANASTNLQDNARNIVIGVVAVAAGVVVITFLVIHNSKKRAITGCVASGGSGMTVTDEKDKQIYALSGDTAGVKAGDRMKLQGKKLKPKGADQPLGWEVKAVAKDFGACKP